MVVGSVVVCAVVVCAVEVSCVEAGSVVVASVDVSSVGEAVVVGVVATGAVVGGVVSAVVLVSVLVGGLLGTADVAEATTEVPATSTEVAGDGAFTLVLNEARLLAMLKRLNLNWPVVSLIGGAMLALMLQGRPVGDKS